MTFRGGLALEISACLHSVVTHNRSKSGLQVNLSAETLLQIGKPSQRLIDRAALQLDYGLAIVHY